MIRKPSNYRTDGKLNYFGTTEETAAFDCTVFHTYRCCPINSASARQGKNEEQLTILTQERLDRFGIEITCHHGLAVWIPTTTTATSVTTTFSYTYRSRTTKSLLHKLLG